MKMILRDGHAIESTGLRYKLRVTHQAEVCSRPRRLRVAHPQGRELFTSIPPDTAGRIMLNS